MGDDLNQNNLENPKEEELLPEEEAPEGRGPSALDRARELKEKGKGGAKEKGEKLKEGGKGLGKKAGKAGEEAAKKGGEKAAEKAAEEGLKAVPYLGTALKAKEAAEKTGAVKKRSISKQVAIGIAICVPLFFILFYVPAMGFLAFFSSGTETPPISVGGAVEDFQKYLAQYTGQPATISSDCDDDRDEGARKHMGYDFSLEAGTPVPAVYSGTIVAVIGNWGDCGDCGDALWIQNDDKSVVYSYGHMNIASGMTEGTQVAAGTQIGTIFKDHLDVKKFTDPSQSYTATAICPW